jgi:dihydropteroate synthase
MKNQISRDLEILRGVLGVGASNSVAEMADALSASVSSNVVNLQNRGMPKVHPDHPFRGGPHIMGVVNVTPDSFSDGGKFINPDKAIEHGALLAQQGATILDIGGESTRPGAEVIDVQTEIARVVPVIEGLRGKASWISIDTRNAATMEAAIKAGANIINDISALTHDEHAAAVVAEANVHVVLMHSQGNPQTMQKNPRYNNVVKDIFEYLQQCISIYETRRIDRKMIIVDPGIGFGKTLEHNLAIIRNIKCFHDLGVPVMLGASRKSFLERIFGAAPPEERVSGSISVALWALSQGVQIYRVHDVKETVEAFKIFGQNEREVA